MKLVNINKVKAYVIQRLFGLLGLVVSAIFIAISIKFDGEFMAALIILIPMSLYLLCTKELLITNKYYPTDLDREEL